jgi:hypothetical protein
VPPPAKIVATAVAGDSNADGEADGDLTARDGEGSGETIGLALAEGLGAWLGREGSGVELG